LTEFENVLVTDQQYVGTFRDIRLGQQFGDQFRADAGRLSVNDG
jgi:hypothetical protein